MKDNKFRNTLALLVSSSQLSEFRKPSVVDEEMWLSPRPGAHALYCFLQFCIARKDLEGGRKVRSLLFDQKLRSRVAYLVPSLIQLFAAGGSLREANQVFRQVPRPNTRAWQAIIQAHADNGQGMQAVELYAEMQKSGVEANELLYVALLKACAGAGILKEGRNIHTRITETGLVPSAHLGNTILAMYVSCKSLDEARTVFDGLQNKNLVSWTTLMGGYAQQGLGQEALHLFGQMQQAGLHPDKVTFLCIFKACGIVKALDEGKQAHARLLRSGVDLDMVLETSLVDMYAKCGDLDEARSMFDVMPERNVISWSAMIGGYAQHRRGQEALELFELMEQQGIQPNEITFVSVLKACGSIAGLEQGKRIQARLIASDGKMDVVAGTSLVDMYVKCGALADARNVFEHLSKKDVVLWNRMVVGYVQLGNMQEALRLYERMQQEGVNLTEMTFVTLLNACSSVYALDHGKHIHNLILNSAVHMNPAVGASLVDMYVKCGSLEDARKVFHRFAPKTVVSCTVMIGGYVQHGDGQAALQLFKEMQHEGLQPDKVTFVNVLKACASVAALAEGRAIHATIVEEGFWTDVVLRSALVDMYAKCGSMDEARAVFDTLPNRDVVFSNAMINAYTQRGKGEEALQIYQRMQQEGSAPNTSTYRSILKACGGMAALRHGKSIHAGILKAGLDTDGFVGSSLIAMYAKCGGLEEAFRVFTRLPSRDAVLWNTMIGGYAQHGQAQEALLLFQEMQKQGVKPTGVTFVSALTACSHAGLLDQGCALFHSMSHVFGITPAAEHYACLVDLLCRAGHLHEAKDLITAMPVGADAVLWTSLLGGCRTHGDVELGELCFDSIMALEPDNTAAFVLMSHIYADAGREEDEADMRKQMLAAGNRKEPGRTWIDVENEVHVFAADDRMHPERGMIFSILKAFIRSMEAGAFL